MEKLNICIISIYPFPEGMAATNRMLAYSKGLVENGANVDIIITIPTDRPTSSESKNVFRGVYQGINYNYVIGKYTNKFKIVRALSILTSYRLLSGYINAYRAIRLNNRSSTYNAIIISTDNILDLYVFSKFSKIFNSKSIFIFDEYPTPIRHKLKRKIPNWKSLLYKKVLKNIDSYVSISEELKIYFNKLSSKRTFIMPVITDTSKFVSIKSIELFRQKPKRICYVGNMELTKDNIDLIIKAFKPISHNYPTLLLDFYGGLRGSTKSYLNQLVLSLDLNGKVCFKGRVESIEVPRILSDAYILVSSQPNTVRAKGGFPTKLGEYIASGTPAIFSDVGENAKYFKDNQHVFFVKPDSIDEYTKKLNFVIENYEVAKEIAANGRMKLIEEYSYLNIGKDFLNFIKKI